MVDDLLIVFTQCRMVQTDKFCHLKTDVCDQGLRLLDAVHLQNLLVYLVGHIIVDV